MVTSLCPYFNRCGGCTAQNIEYKQQLNNKKQWIIKGLDLSHSEHSSGTPLEVQVFSAQEYHYRNRMDFIVKNGKIGLRSRDNASDLIDIEECPIAEIRINELLIEVRDFFKKKELLRQDIIYYIVIRTTSLDDSSLSFTLNEESTKIKEAQDLIREFSATTSAKNVLITYTNPENDDSISTDFFAVKGVENLKERYLNKTFFFSVQGFFQNNTEMAKKMHEYVHQLLQKYPPKQAYLLDLYAGVGTFGIINADLFKEVTIVESFAPGIETAKLNLEENNIKNAQALVLDAKNLRKVKLRFPLYVITDPPRIGMDEKTIQQLKELKPEVIIYVSCNHQQLAKDVLKFKEYEIKSVAVFDLFPQTAHLETVVELIKREIK
ncbi:MAG: 23S rRNA (uracil(1939)-C(5))-methyltransferase RlmD [Candidatus Woesearchaeota archaeon]